MSRAGIFGSAAFLWPAMVTAEAGRTASALAQGLVDLALPGDVPESAHSRRWATKNHVLRELPTMRLRDFSKGSTGAATLVCAPFALHAANIADFAHGLSLVEALQSNGIDRLFLTDWRSATPEMRFLSIDSYLADLNVAVDDLGGKIDLIGICQGGWMGLLYAARFPGKVRKLVIAGAPIDVSAGDSPISALAKAVPLSLFEELIANGQGRIMGQRVFEFWGVANLNSTAIKQILQLRESDRSRLARAREARFREWYMTTVDLPGAYYLEVVDWLFKQNRIAQGQFIALGRQIELSAVDLPVFLLAARDDEFVPPGQVFGAARLLGTSRANLREAIAPGSHLTLFMGAATLSRIWPKIIRWLRDDSARRRSLPPKGRARRAAARSA